MNKEYNDLLIENIKLKDKLEQQRKEYQETYKDVREEIKDYKHQLEEKDKIIEEAKEYLIKLGKQPDADLYYCINEHKEYQELLEILEKGKNGK